MVRLTAALAATLMLGLAGAFAAVESGAQERPGRGPEQVPPRGPQGPRGPEMPGREMDGPMPGQGPRVGAWTIVDSKSGTILLNTATGDSFMLRDGKESPHWQPIERPMPRGQGRPDQPMPRGEGRPDQPKPRGEKAPPSPEDMKRKIEEEGP